MGRKPSRHHGARFAAPVVPRTPPPVPEGLGAAGRAAWAHVWQQHWINADRHLLTVDRYCRLQDFLAEAFAEKERAGLMQLGSHKTLRCHPVTVEIRQVSAELRALEIELALTPSAAVKAGVPADDPGPTLEEIDRLAREDADDDDPLAFLRPINDEDPRIGLSLIEGGGAS